MAQEVPEVSKETVLEALAKIQDPDLHRDIVSLNMYEVATTGRGVKLAVGQKRTIDVAMIANGPITTWNVQAVDLGPSLGGGKTLNLTLDKPSGSKGDVLKLTLERTGTNASAGAAPFLIRSQANGIEHAWIAVAGD